MATVSAFDTPSQRAAAPQKRNSLAQRIWKARISYLLLLIFFVPFAVFTLYPMLNSAYLSLTDYNGSPTQPPAFVGIDNFTAMLSLEIATLPRQIDETTGEVMFQCGRSKVLASEVEAEIADGRTCAPAFPSARTVLTDGYSEWRVLYENNDQRIVIGATDPRFWTAIYNTTIYVGATVIARIVIGLGLALMLQRQSTLNMILRTVFFLPSVTAGVAVTVVWGWIFRGQSYGLVNSALLQLGLVGEPIPFLNDANWTMPIIIWLSIWGGIGYNMIMYLAGLQSIPSELYEAATVDGASTRDKFFHITLPLLRPTTIFLVITGIIGSFQVFDIVYVLFSGTAGQSIGGILDSGLTIVGYLYDRGFRLFQLGYASAIAWVLFAVVFLMTLLNLRFGKVNQAV